MRKGRAFGESGVCGWTPVLVFAYVEWGRVSRCGCWMETRIGLDNRTRKSGGEDRHHVRRQSFVCSLSDSQQERNPYNPAAITIYVTSYIQAVRGQLNKENSIFFSEIQSIPRGSVVVDFILASFEISDVVVRYINESVFSSYCGLLPRS